VQAQEGRLKKSMLVRDDCFMTSLQAHGGRASEKVMRSEAGKMGYGGDAATRDVFYRANKAIRCAEDALWQPKWKAFALYMKRLREVSNVYTHVVGDAEGTFKYAFVCMYPAVEVIKTTGRPVCSTDMGHSKHDLFEGMNATGLFQDGNGTLVPVWSCIFANCSETNEMWGVCAEEILKAGVQDIYVNAVNFRDRHSGCDVFEDRLHIHMGMYCVPHLRRNIIQHKAKRGDKVLEKNFHVNALFYIQASSTAVEYKDRMDAFSKKYPNTGKYLLAIEPVRWVHYAQVEARAATFGWRSNNIGEIGQGKVLEGFRK
jgi:hypothetical protein